MKNEIATGFVLWAIQEWNQTEEKRIEHVQKVLDAAGFQATATCGPVFGGMWPRPCDGPEGPAATAWLHNLTITMRRGHFEDEVEHVQKAIDARKAAT